MKTRKLNFRIVASHRSNDEEREMFKAASLERAVERLEDEGELLSERLGWENFTLQDWTEGIGWSDVLPEALRGMVTRKEITHQTFRLAKHFV